MFRSSDADVFSAAILPSYVIFFPSPSDAVLKPKSKVTFGRNDVLCKKRTRESHWFTPRQPVIFHSLPQRSLHWQDTSLMCSNEIKRFHRRLTIPPLSHSFHFIRLLDCLLNGLPHPPREMCCMYFLRTKWDVVDLFSPSRTVFLDIRSSSPQLGQVYPQLFRYY